MTGEAKAVKKAVCRVDDDADGPDKPGCLYRGTQIVDGMGEMIVTEVGDEHLPGRISPKLSADDEEEDEGEAAPDDDQAPVKHN